MSAPRWRRDGVQTAAPQTAPDVSLSARPNVSGPVLRTHPSRAGAATPGTQPALDPADPRYVQRPATKLSRRFPTSLAPTLLTQVHTSVSCSYQTPVRTVIASKVVH
ncbi:hypothetical protein PP301_gp088 [Gordonia phage GMA2]|uniref:Uncharacterized protein n=1 Tax=Gordonia phage GMA2 TaxID=1647283 RepID=A0A0K0N6R8_9CAUD|nr:hypothetical protein PP301_gp088 [Gordonia phage GMA2]AKJ72634.1 hypothetical protein GMA2_96 [Gordonia phage GMA2]